LVGKNETATAFPLTVIGMLWPIIFEGHTFHKGITGMDRIDLIGRTIPFFLTNTKV
jgi:hypothetical protein